VASKAVIVRPFQPVRQVVLAECIVEHNLQRPRCGET
jgi:hypothetical protein